MPEAGELIVRLQADPSGEGARVMMVAAGLLAVGAAAVPLCFFSLAPDFWSIPALIILGAVMAWDLIFVIRRRKALREYFADRRWSATAAWLGAWALGLGALSLFAWALGFLLLSSAADSVAWAAPVSDYVTVAWLALAVLSATAALIGVLVAAVGLFMREGLRPLAGLALSMLALAPAGFSAFAFGAFLSAVSIVFGHL